MSAYGVHPTRYGNLSNEQLYSMFRESSYSKLDESEKLDLLQETVNRDALERGEIFTPTQEQVKYTKLPYSITTSAEISGEDAVNYEPQKPMFAGDTGATSTKFLGWLREDEHPDGSLCRACPVCGYKYGTSFLKEEVPPKVIAWLFDLPDAEVKPAWL